MSDIWAAVVAFIAFLGLIGFLGVSCEKSCNTFDGYSSVTTFPDGRVEAKCR